MSVNTWAVIWCIKSDGVDKMTWILAIVARADFRALSDNSDSSGGDNVLLSSWWCIEKWLRDVKSSVVWTSSCNKSFMMWAVRSLNNLSYRRRLLKNEK